MAFLYDGNAKKLFGHIPKGVHMSEGIHAIKEKHMPVAFKVILIIFGVIVGLCLLLWAGINIYVHVAYADFYKEAQMEFTIPGLNDGFVVQDLCYIEDEDCWVFSGYHTGGEISPLYVRRSDGSVVKLQPRFPDGAYYDGHGGGINTGNGKVYITCENGYLVFDAHQIATAQEGDEPQAEYEQVLDYTPAFLTVENGYMFVGEFFYGGVYETAGWEHVTTPDGTQNPAVAYIYRMDEVSATGVDATQPLAVLSIPEKVQGIAITPGGNLVLSTSYGLAPSYFHIYDGQKITADGTFVAPNFEAPLYCLDGRNFMRDIVAPPMSEGIILHDGRIYATDEAASNKYIFGKLYGFDQVYSLDIE